MNTFFSLGFTLLNFGIYAFSVTVNLDDTSKVQLVLSSQGYDTLPLKAGTLSLYSKTNFPGIFNPSVVSQFQLTQELNLNYSYRLSGEILRPDIVLLSSSAIVSGNLNNKQLYFDLFNQLSINKIGQVPLPFLGRGVSFVEYATPVNFFIIKTYDLVWLLKKKRRLLPSILFTNKDKVSGLDNESVIDIGEGKNVKRYQSHVAVEPTSYAKDVHNLSNLPPFSVSLLAKIFIVGAALVGAFFFFLKSFKNKK